MYLTKKQIQDLKKLEKDINKAFIKFDNTLAALTIYLNDLGIKGNTDHLMGDGAGFDPESEEQTHVSIDTIIKLGKSGELTQENLQKLTTF